MDYSAPPRQIAAPLELDPQSWSPKDIYFVLNGLVVPRPIAWISTVSADGVPNLAPHSYFTAVSSDPPVIAFSSLGVKDTLRNIRETGELVVNIVCGEHLEPMNFSSADFPAAEDEFSWAGLATAPSVRVKPARVADAPAHLECVLEQEHHIGNGHLVLARVVHIRIAPRVWREGRVDPRALDPICRLSGSLYGRLGEITRLKRPAWHDISPQP